MTLELEIDDATKDRIEELQAKTEEDVYLQITFAVEDLVQQKYQELRTVERQQDAEQSVDTGNADE